MSHEMKKVSLRQAFGEALVKAGERWTDLRVFDAGTSNSTYTLKYSQAYPDRFYTPGINEPGMIALATGLAMAGKRVVAADMSVFLHHAYAQIRAAARQGDIHLIIAATHTGVAVGPDGGSAHDLTDMARMRLIPNMVVVTPWDGLQVEQALEEMLEIPGLYYLRLNRPAVPVFTEELAPFTIGPAYNLRQGKKLTIIAVGDKVYDAMLVADELGEGVADVIGISTLEPLDGETIVNSARRTGKIVTIEDHMAIGGLYEAVAGVTARNYPVKMRSVSIDRIITTSGMPDELAKMYKIDVKSIVETCREFIRE